VHGWTRCWFWYIWRSEEAALHKYESHSSPYWQHMVQNLHRQRVLDLVFDIVKCSFNVFFLFNILRTWWIQYIAGRWDQIGKEWQRIHVWNRSAFARPGAAAPLPNPNKVYAIASSDSSTKCRNEMQERCGRCAPSRGQDDEHEFDYHVTACAKMSVLRQLI